MTSKNEPGTGGSPASPAIDQSPEVSLEFVPEVVVEPFKVRAEGTQDLKNVVARYRSELQWNAHGIYRISPEQACHLLTSAVPIHFEIDGRKMVLCHSEMLGWSLQSLL